MKEAELAQRRTAGRNGRRAQLSAHNSRKPSPAPHQVQPGTTYQLTVEASKGNAFCWLTWEPRIDWKRPNSVAEGEAKRAEIRETKRAMGIDPLHTAGFDGSATTGPKDPMRFAVLDWRRRA